MNSKMKMERDFMGLAVKQEISDEIYDAAPVRSLPMQWSFSNKGSSLPQVLSFQNITAQEDTKIKSAFESLSSIEKNMGHDNKQGAIRYAVSTTFPAQKNHAISSAMATSLHQSFAAPPSSPVVGTTDLRSFPKVSNSPAQLTIFFNGSVSVYDNISPEKAQAIMLLAGNNPPTGSSPTPTSAAPVQPSMARSSSFDGFSISKTYGSTQNRSSPGPAPVPAIKNDATPAMPAGILASSSTIAAHPLNPVNPMASVSANFLTSGTVPQFRKKSLARFLEKRKERVTTASPYGEIQSPGNSRHSPVSAMN